MDFERGDGGSSTVVVWLVVIIDSRIRIPIKPEKMKSLVLINADQLHSIGLNIIMSQLL